MKKYDYIVAQDGTGDFLTIQEAVDAAGKSGGRRQVLVKPGVYREVLDMPSGEVELHG